MIVTLEPPYARTRPYRLSRPGSSEILLLLTTQPLFLGSHWRLGHTWPCLRSILPACPYCASSDPRQHAYIGAQRSRNSDSSEPQVFEFSTQTWLSLTNGTDEIADHRGHIISATRRSKRAPVELKWLDKILKIPRSINHDEILYTLCNVYRLPLPHGTDNANEWRLAVQLRVNCPDYRPFTSKEPTE
jgi:hypothetical protein